MLDRILEPEVMDTVAEAEDYDAMDHSGVNELFVTDFLSAVRSVSSEVAGWETLTALDVGTGTAQIPIELCRRSNVWNVLAIDLAEEMLKLADRNVQDAGLSERIQLRKVDAKLLPVEGDNSGMVTFPAVVSNSIIHHIPEPALCFEAMWRRLAPGGLLFVRDLSRPDSLQELDSLVERYAGDEAEHAQTMFRESLHAALTLEDVQRCISRLSIAPESVQMTSDRHWTLIAVKPE